VVDSHTAGCPVTGIRWTFLSVKEIGDHLANKGQPQSRKVIYRLLEQRKLGRRKMAKQVTMKNVEGRNDQFERIDELQKYFLSRGYAVLSIDVKKKEYLGPFYRPGSVLCTQPLRCYDHDFNSFATGKMVPHGIYDLILNTGYITLGTSADTAEFTVQCIREWWNKYGSQQYEPRKPILILCDGGGANGSRNRLFKEQMQQLADETGLCFRLAHYPPYCSKYNPIEHLLFPSVTRAWNGVMLDSTQTAADLLVKRSTNFSSGLKIIVQTCQRTFETGKKVTNQFLDNYTITHDKILSNWNYRVTPNK
jgi:Rhodopirellula transposase DDE domain